MNAVPTILVVDDRAINREFLSSLFGSVGYRVLLASDGAAALAMVGTEHPDLVISDILMPIMDGVELTRRLHAEPATATLPVVFYTATYRLAEARVLAQSCGVTRVIAKPSAPRTILAAVARLLGRTPPASPPTAPADPHGLTSTLTGLGQLQLHLQRLVEQGQTLLTEGGQMQSLSVYLDESLAAAQSLGLRLTALIELGLDLASERDPERLLKLFVRAAQDIVNAKAAAAGLLDRDGRIAQLATRGLPATVQASLAGQSPSGLLSQAMRSGTPQRLRDWFSPAPPPGLPDGHPPVHTLLVLPIRSALRTYGWLYLADKLGARDFSLEDEQIAATFAAQLAITCENLTLIDEAQARTRALEQEVTERRRAADRIALLNRVYAVLSGINAAIVRIHEPQALFEETCRVAVEAGQFALAWIGLRDAHAPGLRPLAWHSGDPRVTLQSIGAAEAAAAADTARSVLDDRQAAVCNALPPSATASTGLDFQSRALLPLSRNGTAIGVLTLYAREAGFFDAGEMRLLDELAGDISFALNYIAKDEHLHYLAYYDALTDLPNRGLFIERLGQSLQLPRQDGARLAVILVDLDHFKGINDRLGRHLGDAVLKAVAQRLEAARDASASLARVGADSFALAVTVRPADTEVGAVLKRCVFDPMSTPFPIASKNLHLKVRVGVALYPGDGDDAETLFVHAEAALRRAQRSGERYLYFDPAINTQIAEKLLMEEDLGLALARGELVLHYQPKVSLLDGRIVGAEALLRWNHPLHGPIAPGDFIPLAEETGLIVPIGEWVIRTVCAQLAAWIASGLPAVPVAVNLSAVQFGTGRILELVTDALTSTQLASSYLELELTESLVMQDPAAASRILGALRSLGVDLSMDDFGTGYSSLAQLKRFPFSSLKIDRAFVTDIVDNPEDAAIANAIVTLAQRLDLKVVAEGVETTQQLQYLRGLGCDEIQGYLFGKPMPADAFAAMLRAGTRLALPPLTA